MQEPRENEIPSGALRSGKMPLMSMIMNA